jgi:hypothetical protein
MQDNTLSPEELIEQINAKQQVSASQTLSLTPEIVAESTPSGCSLGEVKDAVLHPAPPPLDFDGLAISNPVELLVLLDDNVRKGKVNGGVDLHKWQIQFLLDFAAGGASDKTPFQTVVRACNGSGKDKYIIAPCVVWLCMHYRKARAIVTSSSGIQLDNQTDTYIRQLCEKANQIFGPIWKCNYRYYECLATESPIVLFATDESGKAEGYHPLEANCKMGIFESEAKTVSDEINIALNKCTGYTHRCLVSTPGNIQGHFFDYCSTAIDRNSITYVTDVAPIDWIQYHVTAYHCDHIAPQYIEQMRRDLPGHENGAAFKSQVLAEFGTTDEMVVIPYTYIWRTIKNPPAFISEPHNKAGLDLSDGGDETVLTVRNGNKHLKTIPFRFDNTEDTVKFLNEKFNEYELNHSEAYIYADMGGLGKPILDRMKRQGWSNIRYIDNRTASTRPKTYRNRGAEMYFNVRVLFERGELIVENDAILVRQLSTRYYKLMDGAVHQLLSKIESRSRGFPSPDRADSFVLAFYDYKSTYVESIITEEPFVDTTQEPEKPVGDFDLNVWAYGSNQKYIPEDIGDNSDLREEINNYNKQKQLVRN